MLQQMLGDEVKIFIGFLLDKVESGIITSDERRDIEQAPGRIIEAAGMIKATDPAFIGVSRHALVVMQQKLVELHPELKQELDNRSHGRNRLS